ncbi:ABC transporter substrate-binding protein [Lolliginicoccus suaedae]|uniref:ABC transporter substrate-binding protein n=1 Tax=Lolliginicoccus suaedae TaxID=2605429 RepID=UPI0011EFA5A0
MALRHLGPRHPRPRHRALIATGIVAALSLAGCSASDDAASNATATGSGINVEHAFGSTEVPEDPQRVVSVGYNDQDTLLALGVVPVGAFDWYGDYPGGVWPWGQELLDGQVPTVVGSPAGDIDIETVAALGPDLIVGTYTGLKQAQYEQLSSIAPTVAQPDDHPEWGIPWDAQTRMIGQAVGEPDKAEELIDGIADTIAEVKATHPEFEGKTIAVGALNQPGEFGIYGPADPKVRFFNELGFVNPPATEEIAGNFSPISTEQLSLLDVDVLIWYASADFEPKLRAELDKTEIYQQLDVVKDGRAIILADDAAQAMSWSTVLSLPFALERIPDRIAELLQ